MPNAFPLEFCRALVAVARQSYAPIAQVARDFGTLESCLQRWLNLDEIKESRRPGVTRVEEA